MDRKAIIILTASVVLLVLWYPLVNHFYPPPPMVPATNQVGRADLIRSTNPVPPASTSPTQAVRETVSAPAAPESIPPVKFDAPEEELVAENENARFVFTTHGGGLKHVELKSYLEIVPCGINKNAPTNRLARLNYKAPMAAFTLLGGEALSGNGIFTLTRTGNVVRAEKELPNGLHVIKEFRPGTNYMLSADIRIENRSGKDATLPAQEWVAGTATPLNPHELPTMTGFYWYNGTKAEHIQQAWFDNRILGCFPGTPRARYEEGQSNVVWTAVHNQFFALIVMPKEPAPQIVGRSIDLIPPTAAEKALDPKTNPKPTGYQTSLAYPSSHLAAGAAIERHFEVFAGPREYNNLMRMGGRFGNNVDLVMDFGGFWGWFAKVLLLSMNRLYSWGIPYGMAIIVITVIIKLVFWPLTNASTRSMKRMAELQPQMKALQDKYKDDPKKMNAKLMEYMRENKVNPMGGCLPMFLQIPVFIGFYTMLQSAIELRGASFLWACDLSSADTVAVIFGFHLNPIPLMMGLTMLWQARMTPPSPGMDPMQQKIMKYMPLMFMFILYEYSAALTLYWTVQNLLTIAQMKLTRTAPKPDAGGRPPGPATAGPASGKNK